MTSRNIRTRSSGATLERAMDVGRIRKAGLHFQPDYITPVAGRQIPLLVGATLGLQHE